VLNVLVADDHELLRRGIQRVLEAAFRGVHVFEVGDSNELLARLNERPWDLILLDIMMPGVGVQDALAGIRMNYPTIPVLIFTGLTEIEHVTMVLDAGANGVMHKNRASAELVEAVKVVLSGGIFLHPETAAALEANRAASEVLPHNKLSAREMEIFRLIALGRPIKDIANELDLSEKTVTTYLARIRIKMGLSTYVDMARYALQHKLVE
jgi:DNA-binding NarL/FixJ family response regulator